MRRESRGEVTPVSGKEAIAARVRLLQGEHRPSQAGGGGAAEEWKRPLRSASCRLAGGARRSGQQVGLDSGSSAA